MIYPARIFFIVFSCVAATTVTAETLYKSVNDKGEVTFSDSPPENADRVEQIQVQPAPTEQAEERAAAEPQQEPEVVEPVETYNRVYNNDRDNRIPARPVRPLPGRPVQLPANRPVQRPVQRPAR
jgi:hypothetical protein